jgi:putative transposase
MDAAKLQASGQEKRLWIDPGHPELNIRRQCALLGLSRSSVYYKPARESPDHFALMRCIAARYTRTPFYGSRRMRVSLYQQGYGVNAKRVQRLMRRMGLWGIAPGPRTSRAHPGAVYP